MRVANVRYFTQVLIAVTIGYAVHRHYPEAGLWCLISSVLVLTPDPGGAFAYARARILGNFLGAGIGLAIFSLAPISFASVFVGVTLTFGACRLLKLDGVDRLALAAVLVTMLHPPGETRWEIAVARALGVCAGCLIGIALTLGARAR